MADDQERIRRNVERMQSGGASDDEIRQYLMSEGGRPRVAPPSDKSEQFRASVGALSARRHESPLERARRYVRTADDAVRGAADVLTFGYADELAAAADAATHSVLGRGADGATFDERYRQNVQAERQRDAQGGGARMVGQVAGALAGGLGMAKSGLSMAARAAQGGYRLPAVVGLSALEGAGMGTLYGAGSAKEGERRAGAMNGGVAGLVTGFAVPTITRAARRIISPFHAPQARTDAANALRREGVETTAGQRTGSNALRYAESEIGGAAAARTMERQGEQFTAAALRRAGINATRATPDVIDDGFRQIGQRFDDLAARNSLLPDARLANDLVDAAQEYASLVPPNARAPIVVNTLRDIGALAQPGTVPGAAYQAMRSRLERLARSATDPQLAGALRNIRGALDDAMERSMAATGSRDLGAWRQVRDQYRNMLIIERAATSAGENAAQGIISPAALRNASVQVQGRRAYARGQSDLGSLARAGEAVMKPLPNSGTAARVAARTLGTGIPAFIGYGIGGDAAGLMGSLAGAAAGTAIPYLAGRGLMSAPIQGYLGNQAAALSPTTRAIVEALIRSASVPAVVSTTNRK